MAKDRTAKRKTGSPTERTTSDQFLGTLQGRDYHALVNEIYEQDDRGLAILACTLLEFRVKEAIRSRVAIDDERLGSILGYGTRPGQLGFTHQCRLAYALGVFDAGVLEDLEQLAKVRNLFAHNFLPLNFSSPDIAKICLALKFLDRSESNQSIQAMWMSRPDWESPSRRQIAEDKLARVKTDPRERFLQTFFHFHMVIWNGTVKFPPKSALPVGPKDQTITKEDPR